VFGPNSDLYFGAPGSNELIQVNPTSPLAYATLNLGTAYQPKYAVSAAGYLWFTSNGTLLRVAFSGGAVSGVSAYAIAGTDSWGQIVKGADGNLYVSDQSLNGIVQVTLASGTPTAALGINTSGTPAGIAAGTNGDTDIYVAVPSGNAVRAINPVSHAIDASIIAPKAGSMPESVTVSGDDSIWWGEQTTSYLGTFGDEQPNGSIYISYLPTGAPLKWGGYTIGTVNVFPKGANNTQISSYLNSCLGAYTVNTGTYPIGYATLAATTDVYPGGISGESYCPTIFSSLYGEAYQLWPIPTS
jgi:hypothetical protein